MKRLSRAPSKLEADAGIETDERDCDVETPMAFILTSQDSASDGMCVDVFGCLPLVGRDASTEGSPEGQEQPSKCGGCLHSRGPGPSGSPGKAIVLGD